MNWSERVEENYAKTTYGPASQNEAYKYNTTQEILSANLQSTKRKIKGGDWVTCDLFQRLKR